MNSVIQAAGSPPVRAFKNVLFVLFVLHVVKKIYRSLVYRGLSGSLRHVIWTISRLFVASLRAMPTPAKAAIQNEINKTLASMEKSVLLPSKAGDPLPYTTLPAQPMPLDKLRAELKRYKNMGHIDYKAGQVSGAVYHGGEDLYKVIVEAYGAFCSSNPLHPDVFPGVRKMEAEVVSMVLDMFNAGAEGCGNLTSGGTESILMACKAYRELGAAQGIVDPEMIVPETVHAAFDKAAHYFSIKLVKIPLDKNYRVDIKLLEQAINPRTIMIAGSAPNFPHGIIDDIEALSKIAIKKRIPLHVDCCLGSFVIASMKAAGYELPLFDFRLAGVTSISVDTHKYGFAPKGSSSILYKNKTYRKYQYFCAPDWTGGIYASPSIAGSRPGALIAGCWATMLTLGKSGYVDATKKIVATARAIKQGVQKEVPEVQVIGDPLVTVVALKSDSLNVFSINDLMSKQGWNLNALQYPSAIHIACTVLTVGKEAKFVQDLKDAVLEVKTHPDKYLKGSAAIYGVAASIPDRSIVNDIIVGYLDMCMKPA